jgi:hypothetical protein
MNKMQAEKRKREEIVVFVTRAKISILQPRGKIIGHKSSEAARVANNTRGWKILITAF